MFKLKYTSEKKEKYLNLNQAIINDIDKIAKLGLQLYTILLILLFLIPHFQIFLYFSFLIIILFMTILFFRVIIVQLDFIRYKFKYRNDFFEHYPKSSCFHKKVFIIVIFGSIVLNILNPFIPNIFNNFINTKYLGLAGIVSLLIITCYQQWKFYRFIKQENF